MKKYLSIVLALCLAMTLFVLPTAVSAEGEAVTVSFVAYKDENPVGDSNKVYPGDTITVNLIATATGEDFTASTASVFFGYDTAKLTQTGLSENLSESKTGAISYVAENGVTVTTAGITLGTVTFTVNSNATVGNTTLTLSTEDSTISFVLSDITAGEAAATGNNLTFAISASSGKAQIKQDGSYTDITNNATYTDETSITVFAAVEGSATVKLEKVGESGNTEVSGFTANTDFEINEGGQYIMTITPVGGSVVSVTFNYGKYAVDAKLSLTKPADLTAYNAGYSVGNSFALPVVISGLGDAEASMVKFSVTYDADVLTLTVPGSGNSDYTGEAGSYTITYNPNVQDTELALANNETVEALTFTVATGAANGTTEVTIEALDLALVTTFVDATQRAINTQDPTVGVTVVPADDFATVTSSAPEGYVKDGYAVAFSLVTGAEAKVLHSTEKVTDPAASYATITDTVTNSFEVSEEGYYYLIAKIGTNPAVYKFTEIASKIDATAPVIGTITTSNNGDWTKEDVTVTIDNTTDSLSGPAGYVYSTTSAEDGFTTQATTDITITAAKGTTVERIWVKAVDAVGNASAAEEVTINQDGIAPTVTATKSGTSDIIINVTEADSGIASVIVKGGAEDADITTNVTSGTDYTYTAAASSTYTVVVTDAAGNATTSDEIVISLVQAAARPLKVAISKAGDAVEKVDGFKPTVDNGTFTYVKLDYGTDDEAAGFATTVTVNNSEVILPYVIDATTDAEAAGDYTVVVTTTSTTDAGNTASATYNFKVSATQAGMRSVDENAIFNAFDFAHLRRLVGASDTAVEADSYFTGGRLSADVNADMALTAADATAVLTALRNVEYRGIYTFAIMNGIFEQNATLD